MKKTFTLLIFVVFCAFTLFLANCEMAKADASIPVEFTRKIVKTEMEKAFTVEQFSRAESFTIVYGYAKIPANLTRISPFDAQKVPPRATNRRFRAISGVFTYQKQPPMPSAPDIDLKSIALNYHQHTIPKLHNRYRRE